MQTGLQPVFSNLRKFDKTQFPPLLSFVCSYFYHFYFIFLVVSLRLLYGPCLSSIVLQHCCSYLLEDSWLLCFSFSRLFLLPNYLAIFLVENYDFFTFFSFIVFLIFFPFLVCLLLCAVLASAPFLFLLISV